jgi:hypothetical protein
VTATLPPPARSFPQHDIDWGPVAGSVLWTPAEYRQPTVDEAAARKMLRCTAESFQALRSLGLEGEQTADGLMFDASDLRNAALYSLSGRTEVEMAMRPILAFLQGTDQEMFAERRWTFEMAAAEMAAAETTDRAAGPVLIHPPTPAAFGGTLVRQDVGGTEAGAGDGRVSVPYGETLRGEMVTRGGPDPIADPSIKALIDELLAAGVRWHYLAEGLKQDAYAAQARGVGNCDTMSIVLCDRLRAAGYRAQVYRGWIVGITEVPHSWVEVVDGDGRTKVIDPSLLVLASHSGLGSAEFVRKAPGATMSRIAPTRCPLSEPIGVGPDGAAVPVRFSCRPRSAR